MAQLDREFWKGRRVVVTGHTGFKGAWLCLWLERLGARVTGFGLAPQTHPSLYGLAVEGRVASIIDDLTDPAAVARSIAASGAEIVIHMAAQALVRPSYVDPVGTFATNVAGTVNLLQACRSAPHLKAILVVTSDKVYENREEGRAFTEDDPLGGRDPYSASKACAEIITACFRASFFSQGAQVATARAGNVIGGGDWSAYRIVADLVAARASRQPVELRYPRSVRPWQHVLEPLSGYLAFAEALAKGRDSLPHALNFGPDPRGFRTVADLTDAFTARWGGVPGWTPAPGSHPHEAGHLTLSAEKAKGALCWRPYLSFEDTVAWTADWYAAHARDEDVRELSLEQIESYMARMAHSIPSAEADVALMHATGVVGR